MIHTVYISIGNCISSLEQFEQLTPELIKELIPEIGIRINFIKQFELYKAPLQILDLDGTGITVSTYDGHRWLHVFNNHQLLKNVLSIFRMI